MSADRFEIRRIELDPDTSVWLPGPPAPAPRVAWIRPAAAVAAAVVRAALLPAILGAIAWRAIFFPDRLVECLAAGLGAALVFLGPSLIRPGAIGTGDVKVAACLGVVLGHEVVAALVMGSLLSAPVAAALLLVRGSAGRRAALPFGPFLVLGAALAQLA